MAEQLGRVLAQVKVQGLERSAARVAEQLGRPAAMTVLYTDDPAERRFVEIKQRTFREAGLQLTGVALPRDADTAHVLARIAAANADAAVHGTFLQFPLPVRVDGQRCGDAIEPRKDIDAAGSVNLGRLLAGAPAYVPAAPASVFALLHAALGELRGTSIVIAGELGVLERCLVVLGISHGATVCVLAPHDPALPDAAAGAEAMVITGSLPPGDAFRHPRSGAVLLDAGYFLPPRPREWLSARTISQLGAYLPQYGNVGPLTVAFLIESVLQAATQR